MYANLLNLNVRSSSVKETKQELQAQKIEKKLQVKSASAILRQSVRRFATALIRAWAQKKS